MRNIVTFNALGRYGRLCNQMFQIAGTIGIARKNGYDFAFPEWKNYDHAERFGSTEDIDIQKYFENPLPVYQGPPLPDQFVHWGYHDVRLRHSVSLSGHMQSVKYFAHCFDEVKYYFRMKDEFNRNDYCAVHLRAGDYDDAYHPRLGLSYYGKAILELPPGVRLLLFSDDKQRASELFSQLRDITGMQYDLANGSDYIEDFKLMKSCRHFIIGNSSYSAMAAILGEAPDKKVIAPSPWFGPKYTDITGKDIYCDDWKVIDYSKKEVYA